MPSTYGRGQSVLEIGTGIGWNAALLAHRVDEHGISARLASCR